MRHLLPIVSCLAFVTPASAQTVDAGGAARLSEDLSRYLGKTAIDSRVVTVTVDGNAYRITIDFKALAGLFPQQPGIKLDVAPFSVLTRPQADDNWEVTADAMPGGSLEFDGPQGHQSMQWSVADGKFSGVYDPALAVFLTASGSQSSMTMASKEAKQEMHASTGAGTFVSNGTASAGGGADFTFSQTVADFVETLQMADPAGGANIPVTVKAASLSLEGRGQGYRTRAVLDLLAFVVANSDEATLKANQAELKSRLLAVLPVWDRMEGSYRFGDFVTETPVGSFSATTLGIGLAANGAVQNGSVTYKISVAGLVLPEHLLPPWSKPLLPTDLDMTVGAAGFDLDRAARKFIDGFDLNREPPLPKEVTDEIASEFTTKPPKIVISRSTMKGRDTEIATEGEVTFVEAKPEVNVTVEVAGFDKLVEGIQAGAKEQPEVAQYVAVALAAKGFGKTLPDGRIQWVVQTKADGSLSVNGVMLKGPDPVPAPPAPGPQPQ